ncbi:Na+/H+ antiporter NhaC family protein [Dongshaea marina]|uniref:Na+/H+ antiporter NhaC family protein n=1 Tax=Dongshaea marina TaxID=2047966 RepID=UPI000D3E0466|nr:Na+/H+ antiporter NhaC family protein [Dongshaea marina]
MMITHYADSVFSLLPPLTAVALAIATRRVLLSLGAGIIVGALLLTQGNPLDAAQYIGSTLSGIFWQSGALNQNNVCILLFLLLLGCMISLMTISGATRAFTDWARRYIRTRKQAKKLTGLMVFLFFIDDYFHSLSVGTICRPLTDRFKISRAKLAYLLDSTAAPVCVLMPISSWGAYIIALIGGIVAAHGLTGQSALSVFAQMVPMNFYAVFTLLMVLFVVLMEYDFGPMKQHEQRALEGELYDPAKGTPPGASQDLPVSEKGRVRDLLVPIAILTFGTIVFMLLSGAKALDEQELGFSILGALQNTNVGISLVFGSLAGLASAIILMLPQRQSLNNWLLALREGVGSMLPAIWILLGAWCIGSVIKDTQTGQYLASMAQHSVPTALLPALVFILSGIMAFSTGTSWGTFGIMLPIAGDLAAASDIAQMLPMLSAVLAGSVFGDHCSPISDTTILSSTGASCHHIDHVMTQLPYALTVATIALTGYLVLGITQSTAIGFATCAALFIVLCITLRLHSIRRKSNLNLADAE